MTNTSNLSGNEYPLVKAMMISFSGITFVRFNGYFLVLLTEKESIDLLNLDIGVSDQEVNL